MKRVHASIERTYFIRGQEHVEGHTYEGLFGTVRGRVFQLPSDVAIDLDVIWHRRRGDALKAARRDAQDGVSTVVALVELCEMM